MQCARCMYGMRHGRHCVWRVNKHGECVCKRCEMCRVLCDACRLCDQDVICTECRGYRMDCSRDGARMIWCAKGMVFEGCIPDSVLYEEYS